MIVLFTDFGWNGPYVGQMKAVLAQRAPNIPIIDLMHDAPTFSPQAASYLLASLVDDLAWDAVICAVVDPGVGGPRPPVMVEADGRKFIGPGNGLFEMVLRRAQEHRAVYRLTRAPVRLSASFHGRDLFAPAAAALAMGETLPLEELKDPMPGGDWPDDLGRIIYIDHYGNAMTGINADRLGDRCLMVGGKRLPRGRTFTDHPPGMAFWYANSCGLAEIAVTQGSAAHMLDLEHGSAVSLA
ncbi:hypothetical protein JCM17844_19850 [Iodidimonas gelatinilytica]|uniref:SAM-dependent chlorinase/fluorinase n=1 Tax=Iodidimonas gelatinilytica TaxID=1236966 RepID=A0A5A7MTM3_9PROT|nr:SAM-dependent chlorinase/fluorinase [Iodidimonas gelatinilytica]GEQ98348.1 hypothetical protein JCM17844_19850 [Iodidimonas gelatinilytica]